MGFIGHTGRQAASRIGIDIVEDEPEISGRIKKAQTALFAAMEPLCRLFNPKDIVLTAGERVDSVYRVQSGLLAERRILGDGRAHIRRFLLPGDCFGALGVVTGSRLGHSVEALASTTIAVLKQPQLVQLKAKQPDIELALMWVFAHAQFRFREWETILSCGTAFEKIAAMLHDLCERTRRWQNVEDEPVQLPIGQREIAEHLGLALPHVSRTLRLFRDTGLAVSHYRSIEILNPSALAEYVSMIGHTVQYN